MFERVQSQLQWSGQNPCHFKDQDIALIYVHGRLAEFLSGRDLAGPPVTQLAEHSIYLAMQGWIILE